MLIRRFDVFRGYWRWCQHCMKGGHAGVERDSSACRHADWIDSCRCPFNAAPSTLSGMGGLDFMASVRVRLRQGGSGSWRTCCTRSSCGFYISLSCYFADCCKHTPASPMPQLPPNGHAPMPFPHAIFVRDRTCVASAVVDLFAPCVS